MTGFTHPELNGRVLPFPAHDMEHLRLPPAPAERVAVQMDKLIAPASEHKDSAFWRESGTSLCGYGYMGFMSDASAETYCRQSCSIFTREQLDQLWYAMCSAEPELWPAYASAILQHYEHSEYGLQVEITRSLEARSHNIAYDTPDHLHWYAADVLRAARIALPVYAFQRNATGLRQTVVLLDAVLRNFEEAGPDLPPFNRQMLTHVAAIVHEEFCKGWYANASRMGD